MMMMMIVNLYSALRKKRVDKLTTEVKMSLHYLVKCKTHSPDWNCIVFLQKGIIMKQPAIML